MKKFFMPVEHLRRIRSVNQQAKTSNLGSIKYLPYSLYTLISTIPMPWEENLRVEVLYHINGSLCFINSKRKISKEEFMQKWHKIEKEKGGRCMKYPIFEDDEEIFEFKRINSKGYDLINDQYEDLNDQNEDIKQLPKVYSSYLNLSKNKILNFTTFERRKSQKLRLYYEIPFKNNNQNKNRSNNNKFHSSKHFTSLFKNTRFFQITKMDWLEVSLIIIKQAHEMLSEILRKKKLSFIYLDFNFNLKNTRPLTTKERKKSRLGMSFHLTREICKFFKMIVDSVVVYKKGLYDSKDLKESLKFIFNNVGILTGIYRFKYKVMKQIKKCKESDGNEGNNKDNGNKGNEHKDINGNNNNHFNNNIFNIWVNNWRIYVFMMRGYNSLLQKYLKNLSDRLILGREYRTKPLKKQRLESNFDLELKREIIEELKDKFNKIQINLILRHMNEAWRCWKADINYEIGNVGEGSVRGDKGVLNDPPIKNPPINNPLTPNTTTTPNINNPPALTTYLNSLISTFVNRKAQWYISGLNKIPKNKKEINKRIGKLTRLYIKEEKQRQSEYLKLGGINPDKAIEFYKSSFEYFKNLGNPKINFPDKNEIKHLKLAIEKIGNYDENDFDDPHVLIFKIKKILLTQRKFREITFLKKEVYSIPFLENLTDAFLSSYLFYEADTLGIFPEYFKPGDEIDIKNIYKMCKKIIEKKGGYYKGGKGEGGDYKGEGGCYKGGDLSDKDSYEEISHSECDLSDQGHNNPTPTNPISTNPIPPNHTHNQTHLYEILFKDVLKLIDINLLKKILLLFMDPILVDYLISRNNCTLVYKDMSFENHLGFIPGLAFSPFIFKIYLTLIDFYAFRKFVCSGKIMRYMEKVYLICDNENDDFKRNNINFNIEKSSINKNNINNQLLSKNINYFYNFELIRISSFPNFKFEMAGVECSIEKKGHHHPHLIYPHFWDLQNGFYANLSLSSQTLSRFKSRIDQIVLTSQSSTFLKVITKWNSTVLGFINQFREIIPLNFFIPFEKKIRNVVKQGINSKMPIRFPSVIFYAPQEYGGLGMYKTVISGNEDGCEYDGKEDGCDYDGNDNGNVDGNNNILYTNNNLPYTHLTSNNNPFPPHSLFFYFKPWLLEILDSDQAWSNFKSSNLILKDVGLPRMSTLLQKNKISFYDRSFRLVRLFRKFTSLQYDPLPFTNLRHDGLLYNLDFYKESITSYLGGPSLILKHTLFKATFSKNFSKLFWDDSYLSLKTNTFAQKRGLNQIPNKRFIFWWSPTINRAEVYVGYETILEPTGVVMHGKLPTLKMSYLGIFKNNLWKKIQESLVYDFIKKVKQNNDYDHRVNIIKLDTPSKKSYQFTIGYPDFLLLINNLSFWVDIQLKWGDFDRMNPKKYAKVKYVEYTSHYLSKYPPNTNGGILIVFDLCYNLVDYYYEGKDDKGGDKGGDGDKVKDNGKGSNDDRDNGKGDHKIENIFLNRNPPNNNNIPFLDSILQSILKNNLSLHILRERIRSSLDIYSKEIQSVSSPKEIFHDSLIVEDRLLFTSNRSLLILDPESGTVFLKGVPPGEGKKPRVLRNFLSEDVFKFAIESKKGNILGRKEMIEVLGGYQVDYPKINLKIIENEIPWYKIGGYVKRGSEGGSSNKRDEGGMGKDEGGSSKGGSNKGGSNKGGNKGTYPINLPTINPNNTLLPHPNAPPPHPPNFITNLYKNWFGISKFTSFCRLVLILKSNLGDFNEILSDKIWIKKEREMKNKIIEKYCEKKVMNPKKLNEIEIRDIVFGIEEKDDGGREEDKDDIYAHKYKDGGDSYAHKQNKDFDLKESFVQDKDYDLNQILTTTLSNLNDPVSSPFEIPKNLFYLFCSLTHFNSISFCLLVQDLNCISLVFIPQYSTPSRVFSSRFKPKNFKIKGLMINSDDQRIIDDLIEKYKIENPILIIIKNKLKSNKEIKITEEEGGCYLPEIWDYSKNREYFSEELEYELRLGM